MVDILVGHKIAIYLRISVDEMELSNQSIDNQRNYIYSYLNSSTYFQRFLKEEYIDIGFSGTNEKRPAFQRMIEEVKLREVKIIIVKDMSRFMRNYIALGDYLENIFPFIGVRFISINDNYDSDKNLSNTLNIDVHFKSLMYDFYVKDISEKTRKAMLMQRRNGKYITPVPYGYMKDSNDKYKIVLDPKTSCIVKFIFELSSQGSSIGRIVRILNERNLITPICRKKELSNLRLNNYSSLVYYDVRNSLWNQPSVKNILRNENYTGTYVLRSGKNKLNDGENLERRYNNHEAIVSIELFNQVNKKFDERRCLNNSYKSRGYRIHSILQGLVKCNRCKCVMSCYVKKCVSSEEETKSRKYFKCRLCELKGFGLNFYRVDKLEKEVFEILKEKFKCSLIENSNKCSSDSKTFSEKLEMLNKKLFLNFEQYKLGNISKDEFMIKKQEINKQIDLLREIKYEFYEDSLIDNKLEKYIESIFIQDEKLVDILFK